MVSSRGFLTVLFADLCRHNFRKKGMVWCRRSPETLFSFELQKSSYADHYFISVGVFFFRIEAGHDRPPHKCHFYGRYGDPATLDALDFDIVPEQDRESTLARFRDKDLLQAAVQCATETGAALFFVGGALSVPAVLPQARGLLKLDAT